jgi:hypothetical protein
MEVLFNKEDNSTGTKIGKISSMEAGGEVFLKQFGRTSRGDRMTMDVKEGTVVLTGRASVVDEEWGEASGETVILEKEKRGQKFSVVRETVPDWNCLHYRISDSEKNQKPRIPSEQWGRDFHIKSGGFAKKIWRERSGSRCEPEGKRWRSGGSSGSQWGGENHHLFHGCRFRAT